MKNVCATVLLALLLVGVSGCDQAGDAGSSGSEPEVVHVVLIWLKQPGNSEHRQKLIKGLKELRSIPLVQDVRVGQVIESDRPIVEDSYDVGLYLRFANKADLQAYLAHPVHVDAVKNEFSPLMKRYRVMDFTSE